MPSQEDLSCESRVITEGSSYQSINEEKKMMHQQYYHGGDFEYIEPPFDSPLRRTRLFPAAFNLVATIVGGGVLSLPLAISQTGVILSILLMIFAAVITDFSLYLLCSCARRTQPGAMSYMAIVRYAYGPLAEMSATSILIMYLSGVLVAFCILLKGIFAPIVKDILEILIGGDSALFTTIRENNDFFEAIVLFLTLALMFPLMLQRNLHALNNVCYIGFTSLCIIAISIGIRAYQRNFGDDFNDEAAEEAIDFHVKLMPDSWDDVVLAFPVITLCFLCAFNMVEVHKALVQPTRSRVSNIIHISIACTFFVSLAFGLVGYFYAYNTVKGNIFLNFDPSDKLILVGRLGMGLALMFGMPMSLLPCRDAFFSLVSQLNNHIMISCSSGGVLVEKPIMDCEDKTESDSLLLQSSATYRSNYCEDIKTQRTPDTYRSNSSLESYSSGHEFDRSETNSACTEDEEAFGGMEIEMDSTASMGEEGGHSDESDPISSFLHVFVTFVFAALGYFGAVFLANIEYVWRILGSSVGMMIAFHIPCLCYLKIRWRKGIHRMNVLTFLLLIFTIVASIVCTMKAISS